MSSNIYAPPAPLEWTSPHLTNHGLLKRMIEAASKWHGRRRAQAELSALDDRMLRDIGLDRSEIRSAVSDGTGERRIGPSTPSNVARPL